MVLEYAAVICASNKTSLNYQAMTEMYTGTLSITYTSHIVLVIDSVVTLLMVKEAKVSPYFHVSGMLEQKR